MTTKKEKWRAYEERAARIEVKVDNPIVAGQKWFILGEMVKAGKQGKQRIEVFPKEWSFEELSDYLDRLLDMIWEENNPDENMLREYIRFTHQKGTPYPTSIRVPKGLIEIMQAEDKLQQKRRRKELKEAEEFVKGKGTKKIKES